MIQDFRPHLETLSKRARRAFRKDHGVVPSPHELAARMLQQQRDSGVESAYQRLQEQQQKSAVFGGFGNAPGIAAAVEEFENAFRWGPLRLFRYISAYIAPGAVDSTNTPTTNLRPGLVMGITTATGQWTNYSPTATDGSQIAAGILPVGLPMIDPLSQTTQAKVFAICVQGAYQSAKLLGLDLWARSTLSKLGNIFDDMQTGAPFGYPLFPWMNFVTKTASYQVLSTDNYTLFDNNGAAGAVTFTLPPIANGYFFGFRAQTDQNLLVTSTEGSNIVAFNNAAASTISFQTGSARIGGMLIFYSNPAGTKWIVETASAGANTVTTA